MLRKNMRYFPQAGQCPTKWMEKYAQLYSNISTGRAEPRYLVAMVAESGFADRLTGLMTLFWYAVLTKRAFSSVPSGISPGFEAVCETPFDWAQTAPDVPAEAYEPLRRTYKGVLDFPIDQRSLPKALDPAEFQMLYLVNTWPPETRHEFYSSSNLSSQFSPDPKIILASTNRGRSYALATNPYHKQQFRSFDIQPTQAFMCGFFFLCHPTHAIRQYYQKYWDVLQEPGVLTIGIHVRIGDDLVFRGGDEASDALMQQAANHFDCAQRLEKAFAGSGQKVLWFLASDSLQLRKAAKKVYGNKLITDDTLRMTHPTCHENKRGEGSNDPCALQAVEAALQHSLGTMLTYSLASLHVVGNTGSIPHSPSGFARLGSWLSGRWGNQYQVEQGSCDPAKPVPPEQSAFEEAGV